VLDRRMREVGLFYRFLVMEDLQEMSLAFGKGC
jgi:hypothetical protein